MKDLHRPGPRVFSFQKPISIELHQSYHLEVYFISLLFWFLCPYAVVILVFLLLFYFSLRTFLHPFVYFVPFYLFFFLSMNLVFHLAKRARQRVFIPRSFRVFSH